MKKFSVLILAAAVAFVGTLFAPKSAEALPAFARQVGVACKTCHFTTTQGSRLNQFGREFKKGGMTQTSQELLEDDGFSLPPVMNLGLIAKFRYIKTTPHDDPTGDKTGTDRGRLDVPDEAELWLAGRMAEDWGLATSIGTEGGVSHIKVVYSHDFGGIQGGVIVAGANGMGPAWSMELFNAGSNVQHRMFENAGASNIQNAIGGPAQGESTGVHIFASNDLFFLNVGLFGPASSLSTSLNDNFGLGAAGANNTIDTAFNLSVYYRLALTPQLFDGVDFMIGVQGTAGETKLSSSSEGSGGTVVTVNTESTAIDFQLQMDMGGMPFGLYGAFQTNPDQQDPSVAVNAYCNGCTEDSTGASVLASLGVLPWLSVKASFLNVTSDGFGRKKTATQFGVDIDFAQNVVLGVEYAVWQRDALATQAATSKATDNKLLAILQVGF